MVHVTFVDHRGDRQVADIAAGKSLMEGARDHDVAGILGDCGGACACATCHVHIDPAWTATLPPIADEEEAMLELAIDPDAFSRLSCQIEVTPALDGLVVTLPARQV